MNIFLQRETNQKGFTLIELLVVIAIIGILSTIVMASLSMVRGKARDGVRRAEIAEANKAFQLHAIKHGTFHIDNSGASGNGTGWFSYTTNSSSYPRSMARALVEEGYTSELIFDPLVQTETATNVSGHYGYLRYFSNGSATEGSCMFARLERPTTDDTTRYNAAVLMVPSGSQRNAVTSATYGMNYGECVN